MNETEDASYLPRAILAGAPKCGTTSVFDYLACHPEICASSEKETYYLMDRNHPLLRPGCSVHESGWQGYRRFFTNCHHNDDRILLEATPDYMYQETPHLEIPKWPVVPRVFFMLRRPEERIYSLFRFAKNNMSVIDSQMTFNEFVEAIDSQAGIVGSNTVLSKAIDHSSYVDYLVRWRDTVGSENIAVYLFEDLVRDPCETMKQVAGFLGIDASFYDVFDFTVSNRSFNVRWQWLHKMKKNMSRTLPKGRYRNLISRLYRRLNLTASVSRGDEEAMLASLHARLEHANRRLADEFRIDVSAWNCHIFPR